MNPDMLSKRKELEKLKKFLQEKSSNKARIVEWISSCVAFFSSLKINESIITGFMKTFELKDEDTKTPIILRDQDIGPFKKYGETYEFGDFLSMDVDHEAMYIHIAFKSADNALCNLEEAERLIPKSLLNFFQENAHLAHIAASLELMERAFEEKNPDALLNNAITLLETIFGLEPSLTEKDLSKQINIIKGDPSIQSAFGNIRLEILQAFQNFRLLRNQLGSHKSIAMQYNIPFTVALSAGYLTIMFLQITMSTGSVIK